MGLEIDLLNEDVVMAVGVFEIDQDRSNVQDMVFTAPTAERMEVISHVHACCSLLEEEEKEIESILSIKEDAEEDELRSQGSVEENVLKRLKKNK